MSDFAGLWASRTSSIFVSVRIGRFEVLAIGSLPAWTGRLPPSAALVAPYRTHRRTNLPGKMPAALKPRRKRLAGLEVRLERRFALAQQRPQDARVSTRQ